MSLTSAQMKATKHEFQENIARSGLSLAEIAKALDTTPEVIEETIQPHPRRLQ